MLLPPLSSIKRRTSGRCERGCREKSSGRPSTRSATATSSLVCWERLRVIWAVSTVESPSAGLEPRGSWTRCALSLLLPPHSAASNAHRIGLTPHCPPWEATAPSIFATRSRDAVWYGRSFARSSTANSSDAAVPHLPCPLPGGFSRTGGQLPEWSTVERTGIPDRLLRRVLRTVVHPRVGGGAEPTFRRDLLVPGPSPRGRGSRSYRRTRGVLRGSIPAWAGEPCAGERRSVAPRVHPRVGGGAMTNTELARSKGGPSPRGRGSLSRDRRHRSSSRSIPAWAGEPATLVASRDRSRVHPRVGGGASSFRASARLAGGPSPRGRGSQQLPGQRTPGRGSIPAWAGEPWIPCRARTRSKVHPRVGGGARAAGRPVPPDHGPSPRGRGSLPRDPPPTPNSRSIPAWAGEPCGTGVARWCTRVHPRVGGGAPYTPSSLYLPLGPSPRGRGSPASTPQRTSYQRSIPAWAGEPRVLDVWRQVAAVHPRVGGGAMLRVDAAENLMGPSPRGRGSRLLERPAISLAGSIPAWAGEPQKAVGASGLVRVHPRVGGGAGVMCSMRARGTGPSPRGRGSHLLPPRLPRDLGSIPAWAGEPARVFFARAPFKVHPRVGGGAERSPSRGEAREGPSPRGRGSHMGQAPAIPDVRSIPAWAGEPSTSRGDIRRSGVHPRVGGGAGGQRPDADHDEGPSPRGRGSHRNGGCHGGACGSIPAWAGEPSTVCSASRKRRVHPRVGGGATDRKTFPTTRRGPSPRGRGSHRDLSRILTEIRSIPAWAGEPDTHRPSSQPRKVHPRVGGGAGGAGSADLRGEGPSPRGRGSPSLAFMPTRQAGSIPAWAGEPVEASPALEYSRVHPRVGGGALHRSHCPRSDGGPSPRGRGSHGITHAGHPDQRSIPAWAGEPRVNSGRT